MDRSTDAPALLGAELILSFGWSAAIEALESTLLGGFDPEGDPPRSRVTLGRSDMWFMPAQLGERIGAKLVTVCGSNPADGLPTVQGIYVLADAATATPMAILDGAALTALRTPAVSALAVKHLMMGPVGRLVVFGTGVQARAHVGAIASILPVNSVAVVDPSPDRAEAVVAELNAKGVSAESATPRAVADADLVVCATSSPRPVFDGTELAQQAVVVAIGSHTPTTREVDTACVGRSQVIVESHKATLAESGNILLAAADGAIHTDHLKTLAAVVRGQVLPDLSRPRLFTGMGMAWQDLAIATAIVEATQKWSK